jgi:hypothetical protein
MDQPTQPRPTLAPIAIADATDYQPGVCNIGPAEISRRRRAGHVGVAMTLGLLTGLIAIRAPRITRLLVILPASTAASGYIQARLRFCAGFGAAGVFNFGALGTTDSVVDAEARKRDQARSTQIGLASLAIGIAVGVIALILPRRR